MRILDFSDGYTSATQPDQGEVHATGLRAYADDASFVAANGTAQEGDAYLNSTSHFIRYYSNGAWINLVDLSSVQTLTNKSIDAGSNTLTGIVNSCIAAGAAIAFSKMAALTASRALVSDGSGIVGVSAVTATELGRLSGVLSSVVGISDSQTLTNKIINAANNTLSNITVAMISSGAASSGSVPTANGSGGVTWAAAASAPPGADTFVYQGGVSIIDDVDGIRLIDTTRTLSKVVVALRNSGTSGTTTVKINYGPALASSTTVSVTANSGLNYNTASPAISLSANDFVSVEITAVAGGVPENLSVKLIYS